jgi:pSer/pThr/pTyr-binding forkhead associated (FHA) protein
MTQQSQTKDIKLVVFRPDGSRKDIPLKRGRYVVGRSAGATLRIPLPSVSREHCEIICDGERVTLKDLNSSNGTYLNEERVSEKLMAAGDVIAIGPCRFTLQIDGEPADVQPVTSTEPDLSETPPAGSPREDASGDSDMPTDLDETVTKSGLGSILGNITDDSSVFDFDFDFEDDENPKL